MTNPDDYWFLPFVTGLAASILAIPYWVIRLERTPAIPGKTDLQPHPLTLKRRVFRIAQCAKKIRTCEVHQAGSLDLWTERLTVECHIICATITALLTHFNCSYDELTGILGSKLGARLKLPFARYDEFNDLVRATVDWDLCTRDHLALGPIEEIGEFIWCTTRPTSTEQDLLEELGDILWYTRALLLLDGATSS